MDRKRSQQALGNCNNRLQLYLNRHQKNTAHYEQLKKALLEQEVEFRKKFKVNDDIWRANNSKLVKDSEEQTLDIQRLNEQLDGQRNKCKEVIERLRESEVQSMNNTTLVNAKNNEIACLRKEFNLIVQQYSDIKFKYDEYTNDAKAMADEVQSYKSQMTNMKNKLNKKSKDINQARDLFSRVMNERDKEIAQYQQKNKELQQAYNTVKLECQQEFDAKLADFIQKREKTYIEENKEYRKIFQLEYNRKLHDSRASHKNISSLNKKLESDMNALRVRISKLNQSKAQLENSNRSLGVEVEKLNTALDVVRNEKNEELKRKTLKILELKDICTAKQIQFTELAGIKMQLDEEINLYKQILDKAEHDAGYQSPFADKYADVSSHENRKRRRLYLNQDATTAISGEMNPRHNSLSAISDFASMVNSDADEVKEQSCDERVVVSSKVDCSAMDISEGSSSDVCLADLNMVENMIKICNGSGSGVCMKDYTLTNNDSTCVFEFPDDMELGAGEVVCVFVGGSIMASKKHRQFLRKEKIGKCLYWMEDVWQGNVDSDVDIVRLYGADGNLVSKIVYGAQVDE